VVLGNRPIQGLRLGGVSSIPGNRAEQEWQGRVDRVAGGAGIGADLAAYGIRRLTAESLLQHFEE
jgi:hypothetical protein